jgi:hypothetical protein
MLYKALEHLTSKGHVHNEVRWHHVGVWTTKIGEIDQSTIGDEFAVFCDLEHAVEKRLDRGEQEVWVKAMFNEMKNRIGDVTEGRQLIQDDLHAPSEDG